MLNPYQTALRIPRFLLPERFVKKETVSGIKGKTQGVTSAIKPPVKPRRKMVKRDLFSVSSSPQLFTGFLTSIEAILMLDAAETPPSNATENLDSPCKNTSAFEKE